MPASASSKQLPFSVASFLGHGAQSTKSLTPANREVGMIRVDRDRRLVLVVLRRHVRRAAARHQAAAR